MTKQKDHEPAPAADLSTRGSLPQEDLDDRPNVGTVTPEDYPEGARAKG